MSEPTAPVVPVISERARLGVALFVIACATGLLWMQRLSGAEWVSAVTWIVAAYMLGHAGAVLAAGWTVQAIAKAKAGAP